MRPSLRAAAALPAALLAALLLSLTACGGDDGTPLRVEAGDIVTARNATDLVGGTRAKVVVPSGVFSVQVGDPRPDVSAGQTAERIAQRAPQDGVLLPIGWSFDTSSMEDYERVFGRAGAPSLELVANGTDVRLPSPYLDADRRDVMYVGVPGDGRDLQMRVGYDGVTQVVDLTTGKVTKGQAKTLYALGKVSTELTVCPSRNWVDEPGVVVKYSCAIGEPVVSPYAHGEWAEPGHSWVALHVTTNLSRYVQVENTGPYAVYAVDSSKDETTLADSRPTQILASNKTAGSWDTVLLFDVSGKVPDHVEVRRSYELSLDTSAGGIDAPNTVSTTVGGRVPLPTSRVNSDEG